MLCLLGCSLIPTERSSESGYAPTQDRLSSRSSEFKRTSNVMSEEMGGKEYLQKLEDKLNTRQEIEQYSKALPWFENEQERIEYLEKPNFAAKQKWITEKKLFSRSASLLKKFQPIIEAQDIAMGMPQDYVRRAWGEPEKIEVAGNPAFKNEKWTYSKFVSSIDGYKKEGKVVYFEGGKVNAWEIQ